MKLGNTPAFEDCLAFIKTLSKLLLTLDIDNEENAPIPVELLLGAETGMPAAMGAIFCSELSCWAAICLARNSAALNCSMWNCCLSLSSS